MDSAEVDEGRDKKAEIGADREAKSQSQNLEKCLGSRLGGGASDGAGREGGGCRPAQGGASRQAFP